MKLALEALVLGVCLGAHAAAPVITNLAMVPRLTIQSDVGITNQIQYCTELSPSNWVALTNLVVGQSPYWFVDVGAPPSPQRFYRVVVYAAGSPDQTNMVLIPAGSFTMGDTFGEGYSDELPLHTNYVSPFYIGQCEVTKALWEEVYQWATNHGYSFDQAGSGKAADHPVWNINWYDCVKWCNARSQKEGRIPAYYTSAGQTNVYRTGRTNVQNDWVKWDWGYRLPTEAEWEKAARGGAGGHRFPWADVETITHSQANYFSSTNSTYDISPTRGYHPTFNDGVSPFTSPVGHFAVNGYGLYDMAGNLFEWCWDWYDTYSSGSQSDPRGPPTGSDRVIRGGSWAAIAADCRTAYRNHSTPTSLWIGFRVVLPGQLM